jgi:hypothetical protein
MKSENVTATLDGRNENTIYVRRSYMYEFIILCVISVIVLTITIRNLTSDTVTAGGYTICCIILIMFVVAVIMYIGNLFNLNRGDFGGVGLGLSGSNGSGTGSYEGPVIRIHYV